jgi:hypothetical protein
MTLSETPGSMKRLRKIPWRFQKTFLTPLQSLPSFVRIIISHCPLEATSVTIEQIVFHAKNLKALLDRHSLSGPVGRDWSLAAIGPEETSDLLIAMLGDWTDFWFVAAPKSLVFFADHDEYITFFANERAKLDSLSDTLTAQGFKSVPNYDRKLH